MFKKSNFLAFLQKTTISRFYSTKKNLKSKYESVVGLEIHAQILTKSKLFSGAEAVFAAPANSCVSTFDSAVPGTLPVLNRKCVEAGVKTALALNCRINSVSMFDRKHYFYADLPAGYQITQQRAPLANDGVITFYVLSLEKGKKNYKKSAKLHQLQLEQDSGKSLHDPMTRKSLVDLNRAGVPLMELVFDPDISNGEEAAALVKELMLILTKLKTCSCKMEEGALRVDANISINRKGDPLGVRTEVKNIGSIRGVADSITYEIQRQIDLIESGGRVTNETRAWDASTGTTIAMRDKEVLQDYRFMPEPNLPPLHLNVDGSSIMANDMINVEHLRNGLPELPEETRQKLVSEYGLTLESAVILLNERQLLGYFTDVIKHVPDYSPKIVANLLINDLIMLCNKNNINLDNCELTANQLIDLFKSLQSEIINLNIARLVLNELILNPKCSVIELIDQKNWRQIKDLEEITKICQNVLDDNPKLVTQFKKGKDKVILALAGEIAKRSEQRANMAITVEKLKELLKKT